jgi:DNA-binding transcriptional LysR family regulator
MDTRLLKSFVTVAEELHFGRAAERAHLAQPALSRQVQRLEEKIGAQLLVRDRRKVVLTKAGRAFLKEARTILERVDLAQKEARRAERGEIGSLSFGYDECTLYGIFPELVRLYRKRFPGVTLELREVCTADQVGALLGGELDVGLVEEPVEAEGLRVETLLEEPLVVALPDEHPLAAKPEVVLEDLADERFVLFPRWMRPALYDVLTGMFREAGYVPNVVQEAQTKQTMVGLAAAGVGVVIVNASVSRLRRPGLVYKEIAQSDAKVATALAWRPEQETAELRGFLEIAREIS